MVAVVLLEHGECEADRVHSAAVLPVVLLLAACPAVIQSSSAHSSPEGDCVFCCEDFTADNYVEYQAVANGPWLKSIYCQECIQTHFIEAQVRRGSRRPGERRAAFSTTCRSSCRSLHA